MRLREPLKVKCRSCGAVFETDMQFECVSTDERDMGTEFVYEGIVDERCPNCGKDIYVKIESYEYPIGCVNYSENRVLDGVDIEESFEVLADASDW